MSNQPKITNTRFVLAVQDLKQSADYYISRLGFKSNWEGEGWHFLSRDNCVVMLGECQEDLSAFETNNHSYFGYLEVSNIDQLYEEFTNNQVEFLSDLEDKPWGQRELAIRTVDGHRIMFGEELD